MNLLFLTLIFASLLWFLYGLFKQDVRQRLGKYVVATNALTVITLLVGLIYLFPQWASPLLYGAWYSLPKLILIGGGAYLLSKGVHKLFTDKYPPSRKDAFRLLVSLIPLLAGFFFYDDLEKCYAAQYVYIPEQRREALEIDIQRLRFTPEKVAYQMMRNKFQSSKYKIRESRTDPIVFADGNVGYIVPREPGGPVQTWTASNDGFNVFHDQPRLQASVSREREIALPFAIGEGMQFEDNVWRQIYRRDFFCRYTAIHYLQLDPARPEQITAVAPRIRYRIHAILLFVPYWAGVTLVHADGRIEVLDADAARQDVRLKGKRLIPDEIVDYAVRIQIYDLRDQGYWRGFFSGWIYREGKIEVPVLQSGSQFPFLIMTGSGQQVGLYQTEPAGSADGLFREYYTDLTTGKFSMYQFPQAMLGPRAVTETAKKLYGSYNWYSRDSDEVASGGNRLIDPIPFSREGKRYALVCITSENYKNIVNFVVVNAYDQQDVQGFAGRQELERWLYAPIQAFSPPSDSPDEMRDQTHQLLQTLDFVERDLLRLQDSIALLKNRIRTLESQTVAPKLP
jgi:hypothetical protein